MSADSTRALPMEAALDPLALLHQYAVHFPELKLPHVTLMRCTYPVPRVRVELQIDIDNFEPWREALGLSANVVDLYSVGSSSNLEASGTVRMGVGDRVVEVPVHLYAPGLSGVKRPAVDRPEVSKRDSWEDPHDSPLHHNYALGRDLPTTHPTDAGSAL